MPCLPREHVRATLALYHRHFITTRSPHNHSHRHHTLAHHARTAPLYLSLCTISLHCCINLPRGWCSAMDTARQPPSLSCLKAKSGYLLLLHSFTMEIKREKKYKRKEKKSDKCVNFKYDFVMIFFNFSTDHPYTFFYLHFACTYDVHFLI